MKRRVMFWCLGLLAAAIVMATTGCALGTKVNVAQIAVQVRSDRLLHIAAVPRVLPDGEPATEKRAELLRELAQRAGGYACIEKVLGGWVPPQKADVVEELNDLLLVDGPPEVARFLRERLHEDFGQEYPFVISLPIHAVEVISLPAPPGAAAQPAT